MTIESTYNILYFPVQRFKENDREIISANFLINGDLKILDLAKENDPEIKKSQNICIGALLGDIEPVNNIALTDIFIAYNNFDLFLPITLENNHVIIDPEKLEKANRVLASVNRTLTINPITFQGYSAYSYNKYFSRKWIDQYEIQTGQIPDWLSNHLTKPITGKWGKTITKSQE